MRGKLLRGIISDLNGRMGSNTAGLIFVVIQRSVNRIVQRLVYIGQELMNWHGRVLLQQGAHPPARHNIELRLGFWPSGRQKNVIQVPGIVRQAALANGPEPDLEIIVEILASGYGDDIIFKICAKGIARPNILEKYWLRSVIAELTTKEINKTNPEAITIENETRRPLIKPHIPLPGFNSTPQIMFKDS